MPLSRMSTHGTSITDYGRQISTTCEEPVELSQEPCLSLAFGDEVILADTKRVIYVRVLEWTVGIELGGRGGLMSSIVMILMPMAQIPQGWKQDNVGEGIWRDMCDCVINVSSN